MDAPSAVVRTADRAMEAETFGSKALRTVQAQLFARRHRLRDVALCFSQGRTVGLMAVDAATFEARLSEVGFAPRLLVHCRRAELEKLGTGLRRHGYDVAPELDLMAGARATVLARTWAVLAGTPARFVHMVLNASSAPESIKAVQTCQQDAGLTPLPGWILRGLDGASRSTVLVDHAGNIVGSHTTQVITLRAHQAVMGLALCVDPAEAGKGCGVRLAAHGFYHGLLAGGEDALAIVEPDGHRSRQVHQLCGLTDDPQYCFLFAELDHVL
jgi:hypothetical protein